VVRPSLAAESKGQQNQYFKWKKFDLMCSKIFKLLGKIKGNVINNCDFFNFRNLCQGRPLLLLGPGDNKPSYAIGTWRNYIEYHNSLHLV
jgi:hypothetical protein